MSVEDGVFQGSNVGPILFIMFNNEITKCIPDTKLVFFADDAVVSAYDNSFACLVNCTRAVLSNIYLFLFYLHGEFKASA